MSNFGDPRLPDRFWSRCVPEPNSGCWLWFGWTTSAGYGQIRLGPQRDYAHRVAYRVLVGPIPDGFQIDHLCRVRCCCNPAHCEPVTQLENVRRGDAGKHMRQRNAAITHCPQGHAYTPENTAFYPSKPTRRSCRECDRERSREYERRKARECEGAA